MFIFNKNTANAILKNKGMFGKGDREGRGKAGPSENCGERMRDVREIKDRWKNEDEHFP